MLKHTTDKVDATQVRRALAILRSIDEQSVKDLRTDLKTRLSPFATQIANAAPSPSDPPLSGMANAGRLGWGPRKGTVGFTPGKNRANAANLVAIRVQSVPVSGQAGFMFAELAGTRSGGLTASGRNFVSVINSRAPLAGKGGRYFYKQFRLLRPDIVKLAESILNGTFARIDAELNQ
jgi:hypothetical protein